MTPRPEFLALVGPTASGKTRLSIAVARRLRGEIVSMDSRQVYRGLDVGTAKATGGERALVPHHGLDLVDPGDRFSAGEFARYARDRIAQIRGRGRVPLLVGGTGFFLRAVVDPIFREPPLDLDRRRGLRRFLATLETGELARWAHVLDPQRAELAEAGGPQRLTRTLEIALLTGRPLSWWHRCVEPEAAALIGIVVLLELPREELYRRIDARVEQMVAEGFVEEVSGLLAAGYRPEDPGLSGVGYREIAAHLRGDATLPDAVAATARATRRYARRQLTWFRNQLPRNAVTVDGLAPLETLVDTVVRIWEEAGGSRREERRVLAGSDEARGHVVQATRAAHTSSGGEA